MSRAAMLALMLFRAYVFIALLFLCTLVAAAQDTVTGAFEGRVFSSTNGTYIPGAAVRSQANRQASYTS